jgi:hypothetical protein
MALPGNYSTRTVTGTILDLHSGNPAAGTVVFKPSLTNQFINDAGADTIMAPTPTRVMLDGNGQFSVVLGTTDDPDINPTGWTYEVEIVTGGTETQRTVYSIALPAGGSPIDLADISPTVSVTGSAIIVRSVNGVTPDAAGNILLQGLLTTLNRNSTFETNANGWEGSGGAVARSTAQFFNGVASLLLTPTGGVAAEARTDLTADGSPSVVIGQTYQASGWVMSPTGWATTDITIDWLNAADGVISSVSCTTVDLIVSRWTYLTVRGTAPALAVKARMRFRETGTPAAGDLLYIDEAVLTVSIAVGLGTLTDVDVATATNKDVLQYNSGLGKWVDVALPLDDLGNVGVAAPSNLDVLHYVTGSSEWQASNRLTKVEPIVARKTATETVNNSAAMQNDDELLWAVAANTLYRFELHLFYISDATPDFKFQFTVPAGAVMRWGYMAVDTALAFKHPGYQNEATVGVAGGDGTDRYIIINGIVATVGTAGTLRLQWAQNTANASNTSVKDNSFGALYQI